MLAEFRFAAKTDTHPRLAYAPAAALCLSVSRSFPETPRFLRRYRNSLLAVVAALFLATASGVSAQKSSTSSSSNSVTLPDGTTITANPNTGEITVNLPKTDTTVNINTKDNNKATAKDNKTKQPIPPKKQPAKPAAKPPMAAGGGGGGKGGSIVVTPNEDGSTTVTVTNGGETETVTVNPKTDPQTGETTTTVTSPEDPKSSVSVTNDKNGNTTGTKAKVPNPSGGGFVVGSPGSDGVGHIDKVDDEGRVTGGPTYDGNTQKVEIGPDGIPHVVSKTPEEIEKDKEAKAAKEKEKEKKKTATGTQGSGNESGTATPPESTPPATPPSDSSQPEQGQTPSPGSSAPSSWVNPAPVLVTDSFTGVVTDPAKPPVNIVAYRTSNLTAGDTFSGTVTSDATDPSQLTGLVYQVVKKDSSGNQTVVSQTPVSKGVYKGLIPTAAVAGGGVLIGELLKNGKPVGTATPTPIETQTTETSQPTLTSESYKIPSLMQAGRPTAINFQGGDGDLTTTHLTVGGKPVPELAEGPKETVFQAPVDVTGPTTITISKNGVTGSRESRDVGINLGAASKSIQTGTQEVLTGKVIGLTGLDKPVSLELTNNTPAVQLQGGNKQTVTIAPSDVAADGTYTFERDIMAEHQGTFDITATLDVPTTTDSGTPVSEGPPVIGDDGKAPPKCQGTCKHTVYYKITKLTPTSITDAARSPVKEGDNGYGTLVDEITKQSLGQNLKADLDKNGKVIEACAQGCSCNCPPPKWNDNDKKGKNSGSDFISVPLHVATLGNFTVTYEVNYTAKQDVSGNCK